MCLSTIQGVCDECTAPLVAQLVGNPPALREAWVREIPWSRGRLPTPGFWPGEPMGLQRVGHHCMTFTFMTNSQLIFKGEKDL